MPLHEHARSLSPIRNPKRLQAAELNNLCGACHRKPAAAGDDTDWTNAWNTRHQPLYLAQSACFNKSNGKLSCTSCHAAHTTTVKTVCSECHTRPRHTTAVVAGRACVSCHMPAVQAAPNLRFANHWICVYARGAPLRPRSAR